MRVLNQLELDVGIIQILPLGRDARHAGALIGETHEILMGGFQDDVIDRVLLLLEVQVVDVRSSADDQVGLMAAASAAARVRGCACVRASAVSRGVAAAAAGEQGEQQGRTQKYAQKSFHLQYSFV